MFKADEYNRLVARLTVDPHDLDREYIEHPSLLHIALDELAALGALKDKKDTNAKAMKAAVGVALRDDGVKRTEAATTAEILLDGDVQAAAESLAETANDHQRWAALVEGLKARGYTLRALTDMALAGFTASPSGGPKPERRSVEDVRRERQEREQSNPPIRRR